MNSEEYVDQNFDDNCSKQNTTPHGWRHQQHLQQRKFGPEQDQNLGSTVEVLL